jgi:TRAP transporter TAXI family solute receptor
VDFGVTSAGLLAWAYHGVHSYAGEPYVNLRLIAKIEDPSYLLIAVKADSGVTDLSQFAAEKRPVVVLGGGSPITQPVLDYYGLTQDAVTSWGGTFLNATIYGQVDDPQFDIVITENASPTNNPESAYWTKITQKQNLRFLDPPEAVLEALANDKTLGVTQAVVKWGFLRGVDRPIPTVARTGHVVFARDDMPEQAAYDAAKAIDEHRADLKWFIRPYSYDSRTAFRSLDVPLHPGAERFYREAGYLEAVTPVAACAASEASGGCAVGRSFQMNSRAPSWFALVAAVALRLALPTGKRRRASSTKGKEMWR